MSIVLLEKEKGIAIIKIYRPNAMNALNEKVLMGIEKCVDEAMADPEVQVMIITGVGKAFVAGADIVGMAPLNQAQAMRFGKQGQHVFRKIETAEKPSIAAVNGFALGGGCELAMACDFRIASEKAKFGQPEVGLGITPGYSGTQRMSRLIGKTKAMEMILTGDMITAAEAKSLGLLNKITAHDDLMPECIAFAERIMKNATMAVRYAKKAIQEGFETPEIDKAIDIEAGYFAKCFATKDQKEGMRAFIEKREPQFTGE